MTPEEPVDESTKELLWRLFDLATTWGVVDGASTTFRTNDVSMPDVHLCFLASTAPPEEGSLSALFISRDCPVSDDDPISFLEYTISSQERSSDLMVVYFHKIMLDELQAVLDMFERFECAASVPPEPSFPSHAAPASPMPARV